VSASCLRGVMSSMYMYCCAYSLLRDVKICWRRRADGADMGPIDLPTEPTGRPIGPRGSRSGRYGGRYMADRGADHGGARSSANASGTRGFGGGAQTRKKAE
jgi:hypothetical protein